MPNHVSNILKMKGIAKLPLFGERENKYCEGGIERYFDFNKMIPMPESLEVESGSTEDIAIEAVLRKLSKHRFLGKNYCSMDDDDYKKRVENHGKSEDELAELGLQYISNKIKYGATTWYDWCCNNWGTKWNAYELEIIDDDTIMFQTAWSSPEPVIEKLAEMYPDAHIEHWWADEDMGRNCGYREYGNGCWHGDYDDADSQEAYEHYIKCWGETNCLYQDEDGNWQRHTCEDCHGCY